MPDADAATERLEETPAVQFREPMGMPIALAVCAGGWLLPGLSHVVLGRWRRGLTFTVCILTMFVLGIAMQGRLYTAAPDPTLPAFGLLLHWLALVADAGVGIPYFVAERMGYGDGVLSSPNYDYGSAYLWVAGLLNYLIVLDAFDISQGRKP